MNQYQLLIIGHSDFPKGIKGFLNFFGIPNNKITIYHLDNQNNQDILLHNLQKFYAKNKHVITFADLPGGSPHKVAMEIALDLKEDNHYLVAGASPAAILEIAVKILNNSVQIDIMSKIIVPSINISHKNTLCSVKDVIVPHMQLKQDIKKVKNGGI